MTDLLVGASLHKSFGLTPAVPELPAIENIALPLRLAGTGGRAALAVKS